MTIYDGYRPIIRGFRNIKKEMSSVLLHDKEITLQLRGKGLAVTRSGKITFNKLTVKEKKGAGDC